MSNRYRKCVYRHCKNTTFMTSMFTFPIRDESLTKVWLKNSGNDSLYSLTKEQLSHKHICIDHFDPAVITHGRRRTTVRKGAVPFHFEKNCSNMDSTHKVSKLIYEEDMDIDPPSPEIFEVTPAKYQYKANAIKNIQQPDLDIKTEHTSIYAKSEHNFKDLGLFNDIGREDIEPQTRVKKECNITEDIDMIIKIEIEEMAIKRELDVNNGIDIKDEKDIKNELHLDTDIFAINGLDENNDIDINEEIHVKKMIDKDIDTKNKVDVNDKQGKQHNSKNEMSVNDNNAKNKIDVNNDIVVKSEINIKLEIEESDVFTTKQDSIQGHRDSKTDSADFQIKKSEILKVCKQEIPEIETNKGAKDRRCSQRLQKKGKSVDINAKHQYVSSHRKYCGDRKSILINYKKREKSEHRNIAFNLFLCSSRLAYNYISPYFNFPNIHTLNLMLAKIRSGIIKERFYQLKSAVKHMTLQQRICNVCVDYMPIDPDDTTNKLMADIKRKFPYGCHEIDGTAGDIPAKYAVVVAVTGVVVKWRQLIGYALIADFTHASKLVVWIKQVLTNLIQIELDVRCLVTDCSPFFMNNFVYSPIRKICGRQILNIVDVPYLLRSARNTLMKNDILFLGNKVAKWTNVRYVCEKTRSRLTTEHISTSETEVTTALAAQTFSLSVANAIESLVSQGLLKPEAVHTAELIVNFNNLFDILNSLQSKTKETKGYIFKQPYSGSGEQKKFLKESLLFVDSLKIKSAINGRMTMPRFAYGFIITIKSIMQLYKDLVEVESTSSSENFYSVDCLWTRNLNLESTGLLFKNIKRMFPSQNGFVGASKFVRALLRFSVADSMKLPGASLDHESNGSETNKQENDDAGDNEQNKSFINTYGNHESNGSVSNKQENDDAGENEQNKSFISTYSNHGSNGSESNKQENDDAGENEQNKSFNVKTYSNHGSNGSESNKQENDDAGQNEQNKSFNINTYSNHGSNGSESNKQENDDAGDNEQNKSFINTYSNHGSNESESNKQENDDAGENEQNKSFINTYSNHGSNGSESNKQENDDAGENEQNKLFNINTYSNHGSNGSESNKQENDDAGENEQNKSFIGTYSNHGSNGRESNKQENDDAGQNEQNKSFNINTYSNHDSNGRESNKQKNDDAGQNEQNKSFNINTYSNHDSNGRESNKQKNYDVRENEQNKSLIKTYSNKRKKHKI